MAVAAPLPAAMIAGGLGVALAALSGLYRRDGNEAEDLRRIAGVALVLTLIVAVMRQVDAPGVWQAAVLAFGAGAALTAGRAALYSLPWTADRLRPALVLVGLGVESDSFAYGMRAGRLGRSRILRGAPAGVLARMPPRALRRWLHQIAARAGVPPNALRVVLVPDRREHQSMAHLRARLDAMGQTYMLAEAGEQARAAKGTVLRTLGSDLVLAETGPIHPGAWAQRAKRALDVVLTLAALVVLTPLIGLIWVGLALEKGPVLFRQRRVGRHGRRFTCLKFRTMRPDAEDRLALLLDCCDSARAEWERHQKLTDDPRITRLGRLLRAGSLDELPQLFNVLRGEMSLVGPRPIIAPEVPGYPSDLAYFDAPEFAGYAACTPGLTGLWQVAGRHRTSHAERVRLDQWYARNQSIWLDLVIMARTVRVVLLGQGR